MQSGKEGVEKVISSCNKPQKVTYYLKGKQDRERERVAEIRIETEIVVEQFSLSRVFPSCPLCYALVPLSYLSHHFLLSFNSQRDALAAL